MVMRLGEIGSCVAQGDAADFVESDRSKSSLPTNDAVPLRKSVEE